MIEKENTYLNNDRAVARLIRQYSRYGKIIIAYDFDDTVRDFETGEEVTFVTDLLRELRPYSHLYCYTARGEDNYSYVEEWCSEHNIPLDGINEAPDYTGETGVKLYYNILLDDKAGLSASYTILKQVLRIIKELEKLK